MKFLNQSLVWLGSALLLFATAAQSLTFDLPPEGEDIVGSPAEVTSRYEDTLPALAMRYGLGYREIVTANPDLNPWLPGEGTRIQLPTRFILPPGKRTGVVLNLPELRLYYYPPGKNTVVTYPIGIGREGWTTPEGSTEITFTLHKPTWYPPKSIRDEHAANGDELGMTVPPGPDNPLGEYAIFLNMPGYLMHGTNKTLGVGMRVSHGCIRLYPEDIESLAEVIKKGTAVNIIKQPYKAGWLKGRLYLEAHKPLAEEFDKSGLDLTRMVAAVIDAHRDNGAIIDWDVAETSARKHSGEPVPITTLIVEETVPADEVTVPIAGDVVAN